jgi:phage FluMu gp28-like protein
VPGGAERVIKSNQETVWVAHPCGGTAKINSYPSCAKTLRGVGGDVVYMEEAAFMDLAVFYEVIVPLLEVDKTALICISTPQVRLRLHPKSKTFV